MNYPEAVLSCTFSRELPFSLLLSGRLLPESVLMRDPRESAWRTELMLGVDDVWGDAGRKRRHHFHHIIIIRTNERHYVGVQYVPVPDITPNTSLCKLVSRNVLDLGGVIRALVRSESSLPFWRETRIYLLDGSWTRAHKYKKNGGDKILGNWTRADWHEDEMNPHWIPL